MVKRSRHAHICKTGYFMLWKGREQLQNVQKNLKTHSKRVHNYCFLLISVEISYSRCRLIKLPDIRDLKICDRDVNENFKSK